MPEDGATDIGVDTFSLWPSIPDPEQVETFGARIAGETRAKVSRRRALVVSG